MEIEQIIEKLETEGFPIFKKTLHFISSLDNSRDPIPRLAEKILSDPGMSMKLVKIANSPFFNPGGVPVRTVTRAILMVGLQNIKAIALGLALMEDILDKKKKKKLATLFAQSIARAIMARNLGNAVNCPRSEEIYIAGLIHDIGEISIEILIDDKILERISQKSRLNGKPLEVVQREELGFSAKDLTQAINDRWNLSIVLKNLLSGISSPDTICVKTAGHFIQAPLFRNKLLDADLGNLTNNYETMKEEISRIEKSLKIDYKKAEKIIEESFKEIEYFFSHHFPLSSIIKTYEKETEEQPMESGDTASIPAVIYSSPEYSPLTGLPPDPSEIDFRLISNLSYDLVTLIHKGFNDPNVLFSLVMEFIYNGLNMDVVLFLLITTDRKFCFVRHSFIKPGVRAILLPEKIPLGNNKLHIFTSMMKKTDPVWITESSDPEVIELTKHPIISPFTAIPCFVSPVHAKKHLIGFIYADNRNNPSRITEEHFAAFSMASRLASIGLTFFVSQKEG